MSGEVRRRLYFALWPDAAVRAAIVATAAGALEAAGGRAVSPADLHVTLAFLGGVPASRVPAAIGAAHGVVAERGVQVFDRVCTWPRHGPLVIDATHVAPALAALQAELVNALLAADFTLDRREFRPHITLARAPVRRCAPDVLCSGRRIEWPYAAFVLVESRVASAGSRYTVVETFPLR